MFDPSFSKKYSLVPNNFNSYRGSSPIFIAGHGDSSRWKELKKLCERYLPLSNEERRVVPWSQSSSRSATICLTTPPITHTHTRIHTRTQMHQTYPFLLKKRAVATSLTCDLNTEWSSPPQHHIEKTSSVKKL